MEEINNPELIEETYEDFWDVEAAEPEEVAETEAEVEESAESEGTPEEAEADQPEAEEESEPVEVETEESVEAEADQSFELRHLDEVKTVNREEVIALAQKGMDYDRVRAKYDELKSKAAVENESAKEAHEFVERLAKENGMTTQEFMDSTAASLKAKKSGVDFQTALKEVQMERRERDLAKKESRISEAEKAKEAEAEKESAAKAKRESDIRDFIEAHKDNPVDVKSIPQSVWADVAKGMTLNAAYMKYENQLLKSQLAKKEAAEKERAQREKNKARSTGSVSTEGDTNKDGSDWWFEGD